MQRNLLLLAVISNVASAAPFEIKVHDELISSFGEWAGSAESHLYRSGVNQPTQGKEVFQTMFEASYGVTHSSEVGFHAFVSRHDGKDFFNGGKIAYQVVPTHDESGMWHYGLKVEAEYLRDLDGHNKTAYEITPILAVQFAKLRIAVNPSIDFSNYGGPTAKFLPSVKATYPISSTSKIGAEWYSEMGPLSHFLPQSQRYQMTYLTLDNKLDNANFNIAIGKSANNISERWLLRLVCDVPF